MAALPSPARYSLMENTCAVNHRRSAPLPAAHAPVLRRLMFAR